MAKTKNFADIIRRQIAGNQDLSDRVETESINAHIAVAIYDARTSQNLTQSQLAEQVGTHQTVIARLEDADYDGHSLSMLRRIADALDHNLRIELFPKCKHAIDESFEEDIAVPQSKTWNPEIQTTLRDVVDSE